MTKDSNKIDWVENAEIGQDFVTPDGKHNFYRNKDGNLVIVFDKYEVPEKHGYSGVCDQ